MNSNHRLKLGASSIGGITVCWRPLKNPSPRGRFYDGQGASVATPIPDEGLPTIAPEFDAATGRAAIYDSQRNGQHYRDFSRRVMAAGDQGSFAFLRGKRVTYFGRNGDQHTE